ncbi:MAG: hypothetical protein ACREQT_00560, partial [Candidatus Binataceae bacterium]
RPHRRCVAICAVPNLEGKSALRQSGVAPVSVHCPVPAPRSIYERHQSNIPVLPGGTPMPTSMLLGALFPLHIGRAWRAKKNRATGIVMLAFNAVLIATALGLYYVASET